MKRLGGGSFADRRRFFWLWLDRERTGHDFAFEEVELIAGRFAHVVAVAHAIESSHVVLFEEVLGTFGASDLTATLQGLSVDESVADGAGAGGTPERASLRETRGAMSVMSSGAGQLDFSIWGLNRRGLATL